MSRQPLEQNVVNKHIERIAKEMNLTFEEASYFVISDKVHNSAYSVKTDAIKVKMKDGQILDAAQASDHMNLQALSGSVEKFFLAYKR
jgi:hypothetical protein